MSDINQHIIDQLGSPRTAIIGIISTELNEIQAPLSGSSRGLVQNICKRLLKDSGDCITMTKEQLLGCWDHTTVPRKDLETAIDLLIAKNFLTDEHDFIRIRNNSLGKYIHAAIEADVTSLSKVESMVMREYRSYEHNKRFLSQQEINQVEPDISRLFLPTEVHKFVLDSISYRRRQRIRRNTLITLVFIALSLLTVVAFWQSNEAKTYAAEVVRISDENTEIEKQKRLQLASKSDSIQELLSDNQKLLISEQARANTEADARQAAVLSKQETEVQLGLTLAAKKEAETQKIAADSATDVAKRQTRTADSAKLVAIKQSIAADSAKLVAIDAQENAEMLRSALLSVVLAEKSLATPVGAGSDTMRSMVARVAFELEAESNKGHDHQAVHPKLYSALYYAHKQLYRSTTHNADKLGSQPIHAMSFDAQGNTLYLSYGVGGFRSMHFTKSLSDADFDFPDVDSLETGLIQPSHNLLLTEDHSLVMTSDEQILLTNINNKITSTHRISNGTKILSVIEFDKENEYLVLTSTNSLYKFNSKSNTFTELTEYADVSHVAYIKRLNIMLYSTLDDQIYLVNFNKNITAHWRDREGLSQLAIKDYGDQIFIVFGYLNGQVRVGITNDKELAAHNATNDKPVYTRALVKDTRLVETILSSNIHTGFITDIDFAENTHQMVVASGDGTATIWNLDAWSQRRTDYRPILLDDHRGWVTSCAINADENLVFTGTKHGIIKFWSIDPTYYAENICTKLNGRSFNKREWGIYIGNEVLYEDQICK